MCNLCHNTGWINLNEWTGPMELDEPKHPCPRCNCDEPRPVAEPDYSEDLVDLLENQGAY